MTPNCYPRPPQDGLDIENFEIVKKMSKKNIDNLNLRFSQAMAMRNGQESFATVEPQRVAAVSREALFNKIEQFRVLM